ncbi:MAG: outer membrane protein assembly factor BamB, partial [Verrucomicrobiales bacterium]
MHIRSALTITALAAILLGHARADENSFADQWHSWRGPLGTGASIESYEKGKFNETPVWTYDAYGRGTPIVVDGVLYAYAYRHGSAVTVREENKLYDYLPEMLLALNPETGARLWERQFPDYISDTVYNRYGTGSPSYDPETGNFYVMMSNGHLACVDSKGTVVWEVSMIEEYGSLTFPNGRTGVPILEGDLVIGHRVTTNWGAQGPALDRFYAFDKRTGKHVWAASPGVAPQDSSFSTPFVETRNGQRVMYVGTGCGNLVAINVLTGKTLWRYQMCHGGINSSPVVWNDRIIAVHGVENIDSSEEGRMVAIKIPEMNGAPTDEEVVLGKDCELWRLPTVNSFTSSTVLVGDRAYQVTKTGSLVCIDPEKGEILWEEKLGTDNLGHASPTAVNGLLIVPLLDGNVYVIKPTDEKAEILHKLDLEGACNGAPAVANGKVFIETTEKLYCFAFDTGTIAYAPLPPTIAPKPGKAVALQAVPS